MQNIHTNLAYQEYMTCKNLYSLNSIVILMNVKLHNYILNREPKYEIVRALLASYHSTTFSFMAIKCFIWILFNAKKVMLLVGYFAVSKIANTCRHGRQYQY